MGARNKKRVRCWKTSRRGTTPDGLSVGSGKNERSSSVRAADGGRVLFEPLCRPPSRRLSECVRLAARTKCGHRVRRKKDNPLWKIDFARRETASYSQATSLFRNGVSSLATLATRHAGRTTASLPRPVPRSLPPSF